MKYIYLPILVFILFFENANAIGNNDSLFSKRDQINIGTTGFFLPVYGDYNFTVINKQPFQFSRLIISHISYETKLKNKYTLQISYDGFATKLYRYYEDKNSSNDWYSRSVKMFVFSTGLAKSIDKKINSKISLGTKIAGAVQLRIGGEYIYVHSSFSNSITSLGLKLAISEELVYKKRFVIGFNAGIHGFYMKHLMDYTNAHTYFSTNALYLGVKY